MARQTNRRSTGRKTTRRKSSKSKSASRGAFLGIGLISLLIGLITISVMTITNNREKGSKEEKVVTIIPAKKKEEQKESTKVVSVPKKEEKKQEKEEKPKKEEKQVAKKEDKKEPVKQQEEQVSSENIADLIRLVLYDHEISRSSVTERKKKNSAGKNVLYFEIVCDENMQRGVSSAISSLMRKKGYTVKSSNNQITASSKTDEYSIILKSPVKEVVKKQEDTAKPVEKKEKTQVSEIEKPKPKYPNLPAPAKKQVQFAILLDDGGNSLELAKEFAAIKYPVAIAVLPHLEYTKQTAQIAKKAGKTVFLHFPMAPKSYPNTDPGKGAVLPNMPQLIINGIVRENFENIGIEVDGFNNHMGSGITEDAVKMEQILLASKAYTNRFVDSRTTANTKAYAECKKAGYKCGENRLFIDNDNSVEAILAKIYEAAEKSRDDGSIIAIGHVRPNTLQALKIALPELEKRNYKLVSVTSLTK